jgi:SH3 domain-containing YSC84-like protein 1
MKTTRVVQAVAAACALSLLSLMLILTVTVSAAINDKQKSRLEESAMVLTEIHAAPDKDIPQDLWDRATCVIVIPSVKKAAFVFGGEYGKGVMSCKQNGAWSAPLFMQLQKGSWGLQIGAQSIDLVLLVNNERGMKKLLGNKVTLGAEASVAAGPVGRDARAATDAQMHAEILSYSRTQGLFAGINLSGGILKPDSDDNEDAYGKNATPTTILTGSTAAPAAAQPFMTALHRK